MNIKRHVIRAGLLDWRFQLDNLKHGILFPSVEVHPISSICNRKKELNIHHENVVSYRRKPYTLEIYNFLFNISKRTDKNVSQLCTAFVNSRNEDTQMNKHVMTNTFQSELARS
jgi:hypothetical protein